MIKFTITKQGGGKLYGLGLSRKNCEKLLEGLPIKVSLFEMGGDTGDEVLLMAGETEAAIRKELEEFIGPDTKQMFGKAPGSQQ